MKKFLSVCLVLGLLLSLLPAALVLGDRFFVKEK